MTSALADGPHGAALAWTLAGRAMDAARASADVRAPVEEGLRDLERLNTMPLDADLAAWARRIAITGSAEPLLGTGLSAAPYPALLWNGERASRARSGPSAVLTLVGLAVGRGDGAASARLGQGVTAGLAIRDTSTWPGERAVAPTAASTTDVICAAACAAVTAGMELEDVANVLDIAGSLMIIKPASSVGSAEMSGLWNGHALAAGWLAVQLHRADVSGMSGGLEHTLTTVAGAQA